MSASISVCRLPTGRPSSSSALRLPRALIYFIFHRLNSIDHSRMTSLGFLEMMFATPWRTNTHVIFIKAAFDMPCFDCPPTNQKSSEPGNRLSRFETFVEILDPGRISIRDPRLILRPLCIITSSCCSILCSPSILPVNLIVS